MRSFWKSLDGLFGVDRNFRCQYKHTRSETKIIFGLYGTSFYFSGSLRIWLFERNRVEFYGQESGIDIALYNYCNLVYNNKVRQ